MDRMKDMLPKIAQQRARASARPASPSARARAAEEGAYQPAPRETREQGPVARGAAPPVPSRSEVSSGRAGARAPVTQQGRPASATPGSSVPRALPPATSAGSRSPEQMTRPAPRRAVPVERGPITPRSLPSARPAGSTPRSPVPPADVLDGDRILELPADRRSRPAARVPARTATTATPAAREEDHVERPMPPARRIVRRGGGDLGGGAGVQSLGDALHGYVAVLAERRRQRQAGLDDRGRPAKAPREPLKSDAQTGDVCPLCGGAGWLRIDVAFGDPRFGQPVPCKCKEREIEERHRREAERRTAELDRFFSLQPFKDKTFDTFDPKVPGLREAYVVAQSYAEDPQGWLLLMGGYGTGKTHLAAGIAHDRLAAGSSVYFAVVPELLDHLRSAFAPGKDLSYDEMFDKIREVELLVLDDLGAENGTAWATEKLFQLINYRYNYRMPTVITTNNQLQSRMDDRVRSRLDDLGLVQRLVINAKDFRPRNARGIARG